MAISIVAWSSEVALLVTLWSTRTTRTGLLLFYMLPVLHVLPWLVAMQHLWKVRRGVRNGALDAAGASMSYRTIVDVLFAVYLALAVIESMLASIWKA